MFFPSLSNEYISLIPKKSLFYILFLAWNYKQVFQYNLKVKNLAKLLCFGMRNISESLHSTELLQNSSSSIF